MCKQAFIKAGLHEYQNMQIAQKNISNIHQHNVSVNPNWEHPSPPPPPPPSPSPFPFHPVRQTPRHLTFMKILGQTPGCAGRNHGQMPRQSGSAMSVKRYHNIRAFIVFTHLRRLKCHNILSLESPFLKQPHSYATASKARLVSEHNRRLRNSLVFSPWQTFCLMPNPPRGGPVSRQMPAYAEGNWCQMLG